MNNKDVLEIIKQGENSAVEFKEKKIRTESLAKEIVAFANMNGGVILLGVDDLGKIVGIDPENFNYEEWVCNISRNNVSPSIVLEFSTMLIDNKYIGIITVPKGNDKPYQSQEKFYIRIGSTNRVATPSELMRLFQASGVFHYDSVCVDKSGISNLDFTKLDKYFSRYDLDFSSESQKEKSRILINTDILCNSKKLTVAGFLTFGINPSKYLHQSGISFAHFAGNEIISELIDKQNIDGTLDYIIDTTLAVVKNNLLAPSIIKKTKRVELNLYPSDKVIREIIVNACCHRNYSIVGSRIRIFMFDNRIEFISPGRLPNTVNIEKIKYGVSYAVNPVIVKFLENMRYIDRIGRGIPMICREAANSNKRVTFEEIGEEFKVTLFL